MNTALTALWLPILVSAVVVFFTSSLFWMVIQHHNSDWKQLPNEEALREALRGAESGLYALPYAADGKDRQSEEWQRKFAEGPVAMMTVMPHGTLAMGKQLLQWFIYCLVISLLVAYVAASTLSAEADYLKVFQVAGTAAVLAYSGNSAMNSIWFGHRWSKTLKDILDGVVYGLLTAGVFGWLWP